MTMATNQTTVTSQQAQSAVPTGHQSSQNDPKQCNEANSANSFKPIDSSLFNALQNLEIDQLFDKDIMYVLPFLAKLLLSPSFIYRQELFRLLYPIKTMNDVIQLILEKNVDTFEPASVPPIYCFESCSGIDKLRIVGVEYIRIQEQARQASFNPTSNSKLMASELFDNPIYVNDISYCLSLLLLKNSATAPMMNILDMSEALLHIKFGPTFIIRLVANMPDRCQEVCHSLITFGERQDEGANFSDVCDQRAKTLRALCLMNPSIAFTVRSVTLHKCKMPSLTIMITLDHLKKALENYNASVVVEEDCDYKIDVDNSKEISQAFERLESTYDSAIAFVTGIFLGADEDTRSWFAQYTKSAQQKRIDQSHYTVLSKFRAKILAYMNLLFPNLLEDDLSTNISNDDSPMGTSNCKPRINLRKLNKKLIRATATLRLFCALRGIGSLKLNSEESDFLLRLITCKPTGNQASVNFATTGVCTLLACSVLINNQKEERRAAEWLKWLIEESNYSDNRYSSQGKCSISELLLLIAIHFQNNQTSQIAELVCKTLGMKLQIKASVSKCKSLFVQEVFNDQMMAEHAVKVPVTINLNNDITEFLPVHCIHQLLESRSFSKHQVPIKNWIFKQICESAKPVHHILPKLIEAYVNSVIISTSAHGHCGTNQPISEEDITKIFETRLYSVDRTANNVEPTTNGISDTYCSARKKIKREKGAEPVEDYIDTMQQTSSELKIVDVEVAQVLLLYYLVLYEDIRLKKNPDLSASERSKLIKYSPDFMMEIPIFYLLQLVRDNQSSFGPVLPDLLKLVTSQYPQLCSIQHWLTIEHHEPSNTEVEDFLMARSRNLLENPRSKISTKTKSLPKAPNAIRDNLTKQFILGFRNIDTDPACLAKTLGHIASLPREEIWPFVNVFIRNLPQIMILKVKDSMEYKKLIQATTKLWWKFNSIFPRKLWVMTVNALRRPQSFKVDLDIKPVEYSWDELTLDPLIVLRCDIRVFRCVDILNIVLHILSAFLAASRRCLLDQIQEQPRQKDVRNLEELRATLILAQTSAAIQILLESCISSDDELEALNKRENDCLLDQDSKSLLDRFDASVNCICEHLHQVFIADTNLAKLVHFQTYSSELLATTSGKIPSMHICLDFIPELLSQPDLTKQIFVIELTSHLCEKYAITKSLNVAKLCFNVAYTLLQLLPSGRRALFFIPVLPALLRISKVFPILREDADIILTQINQITLAHMASTSSRLSLGSAQPFEGLERMSWRDIKKLMTTLSLNEALYLCIQRCCLDLKKMKESNKQAMPTDNQPVVAYSTIFAYGNHVINPTGG